MEEIIMKINAVLSTLDNIEVKHKANMMSMVGSMGVLEEIRDNLVKLTANDDCSLETMNNGFLWL